MPDLSIKSMTRVTKEIRDSLGNIFELYTLSFIHNANVIDRYMLRKPVSDPGHPERGDDSKGALGGGGRFNKID